MRRISIIVPTRNEGENVAPLVRRIHRTCELAKLNYELIFIDDHSEDETWSELKRLTRAYPIRSFRKIGARGKAQSLIEGFACAKYSFIAMIDADLQYPPEAIPKMVEAIEDGESDVVVANRTEHHEGALRAFVSKTFHFIFARALHGLDVDTQSGLKVFRKEIIERITLNPAPWAFDMEFLVKAMRAGYRIGNVDIVFGERYAGESKINVLKASWEIGISALRLKLTRPEPIPFHGKMMKKRGNGFHHAGSPFVNHTELSHAESALYRMSRPQMLTLMAVGVFFVGSLIANWHMTLLILIAALTTLYFADLIFNLFLIVRSFTRPTEIKVTKEEIDAIPDEAWPTYTIFCPLYKEWQVLPQFVTAMSRLDYPKDRLQIMLLLEEDDVETVKRAKAYDLPPNFEITVVPHSMPKTKPKACNYGLIYATGDYSVIYDAEDVPDSDQLKKAVLAFQRSGPDVVCVQAKLNFYNSHQNILTRIFAAEYSLWFDLVLTGLQSINAPIPLGGTSNHFRTDDLVELKGWDAFNVTEDCDLGMRLVKQGHKTAIVDSMTMEEGTSRYKNWFRQRSRWIKGYIQTYLVHMRNPRAFKQSMSEPHLVAFQFIVGGKILSMFINPLMWVITFTYFAFRPIAGPIIEPFFPGPILIMGVLSFVFGNFLYLYYYMVACAKRGYDDLIMYVFFVPFYWLSMSGAAWMAMYEMVVRPHYWQKTIHGFHLVHQKAQIQARNIIGQELVDAQLTAEEHV
ncbi:MAG: glycosyltransferase [Patescibacteria group bacterium]